MSRPIDPFADDLLPRVVEHLQRLDPSRRRALLARWLAFFEGTDSSAADGPGRSSVVATGHPMSAHPDGSGFKEALARELSRSRRYAEPVALVLFELGADAPAKELDRLIHACVETIRDSDVLCQVGERRLAAILPHSDGHSAHVFGGRVSETVVHGCGEGPRPILRYGMAAFPDDGDSPTALFASAEGRLRPDPGARDQGGEGQRASPSERSSDAPYPASRGSSRSGRRSPRVSLRGSGAYVILEHEGRYVQGTILDLSSEGVGFLLGDRRGLPETVRVRLHLPRFTDLPPLPSDPLTMRLVYLSPTAGGLRVGGRFAA